jgi:hypothetical protein
VRLTGREVLAELGISTGEPGEPLRSLRDALAAFEVNLSRDRLRKLRRPGLGAGADIAARVLWAKRLRDADASLKNHFCLKLCQVGLNARDYVEDSANRHLVYGSNDLVPEIARQMGTDPNSVRSCLRFMRADLVLAPTVYRSPRLRYLFFACAATFIDQYLGGRNHKGRRWVWVLHRVWDRGRPRSFYYALCHFVPPRIVGSWVPHELVFLEQFYRYQLRRRRMTPLDRLVLESAVRQRPSQTELLSQVEDRSGVVLNRQTLQVYRQVLAFGETQSLRLPRGQKERPRSTDVAADGQSLRRNEGAT